MHQLSPFQKRSAEVLKGRAPLAERMRPTSLETFVGQDHLLAPGKILDRMLRSQKLQSFVLWGPPGSGKTTLARIIATQTRAHLIAMSAVMAGTREIRSAVEEAQGVWAREQKRTWLFMDEIHRLNKAQQDTLLPHVERGTLLLLGATTENPSFEIIRPLLSRARVLVLQPLSVEELRRIVKRALTNEEDGLGKYPTQLLETAESLLFEASGGDARIVLNALEMAVLTTSPGQDGIRPIDDHSMADALQRKAVHYDKGGEEHFNLISALHKSIRGSDPDAGLYWLARMLEAGEDPLYLARRLVRMALEDVGLADPLALVEAISALQSYQFLGSPEGDLALAQIVVYLALAPKSNAVYSAFGKAHELARKTGTARVPMHLCNASTPLLKQLGYGKDYRYPHDAPEGWVRENYFPETFDPTVFYDPTSRGWEGERRELLKRRRHEMALMKKQETTDS
jgi:putative ATPase